MAQAREGGTVRVEALTVAAKAEDGRETVIVHEVGFAIPRGEVLALIGESGSGKTTIALAMMGYARRGCAIRGGSIDVFGTEVLACSASQLRRLRGNRIAYIAQSAAASFNPARTIMAQVIESALIHGSLTAEAATAKAKALFAELALPNPDTIGERYPHQVSGGQLQRLLAAMALLNDPDLVIFDEPTTALDVTTQIEVLVSFKAAIRDRGITGIYVSHDLAVVAQIADRIAVLRHGRLAEIGAVEQMVSAPAHPYTRQLIAAAAPVKRKGPEAPTETGEAPVLAATGITAGYGPAGPDGLPGIRILHDVGFSLRRGETLGIIGESGSGKSTLARVIAGIVPAARGAVRLDGRVLPPALAQRDRETLRRVQIVFQNADTVLNPAQSIGQILERPLAFYHRLGAAARRQRLMQLLDQVRLPRSVAERYPGELSGGQKQRVNLARALAAEPNVILCDEVTSALDTVVGEAVLDLLVEIQRALDVAYVFISHDLGVIRSISDAVMVLQHGRVVESGPTEALLADPKEPYTRLLLSSVPELRTGWLDDVRAGRGVAA
ncbi:ABC transporter ATP-binding protein [Methylobacterium nonmethylotrophicum]|uniref:ABC transporter ATP-binding protein n=1 Tax=Methylobacterium nonmethylotrophicum TaxID=1141884 RepID=A0A4Z0NZE6_9HYPH|nr:ABC transporter ATP-binding protein [Methylobacterium nonmethylotrophicum]TGE02273.1 ABC transporter ATP-binding protein [Methylobacterium nonmethylotrophicum]